MIYVIEFNITATCMIFFQNKCVNIIISFAYYMTDIIPVIYSVISIFLPMTGWYKWMDPQVKEPHLVMCPNLNTKKK